MKALALAACGSGSTDTGSTDTANRASAATDPSTPAPPPDCAYRVQTAGGSTIIDVVGASDSCETIRGTLNGKLTPLNALAVQIGSCHVN